MRGKINHGTLASGDRRQMMIGGAIMVFSLVVFFSWGFYFQLWDTQINWSEHPVEYGGFGAWIIVGFYGIGYAYGGNRSAFRSAVRFSAYAVGAVLLGVLIRWARR